MPDGRYISERDWPIVWDLIRTRRAGGFNRPLDRPQRTLPQRHARRVVLLEPAFSYQTVWAAWTQREAGLNAIDLRILGFVTGGTFALEIDAGGATYRTPGAIPYNAAAGQLQQALALAADADGNQPFRLRDLKIGLGGQPHPEHPTDPTRNLNPGRWIIEFGGRWIDREVIVRPQYELYRDPFVEEDAPVISSGLAGTVVEMHSANGDWFDSGHVLQVQLGMPIEDPNPLRAGSVCQVHWIASAGWTICAAEPRKYIDETVFVPEPYVYSS